MKKTKKQMRRFQLVNIFKKFQPFYTFEFRFIALHRKTLNW